MTVAAPAQRIGACLGRRRARIDLSAGRSVALTDAEQRCARPL